MVSDVVSDRVKGFREVASNILDDSTMSDALNLVNQAVRMMETGREITDRQSRFRADHPYV